MSTNDHPASYRFWLPEPEYVLGCLGFMVAPKFRRRLLKLGALLSLVVPLIAGLALAVGRSNEERFFEAVFLVVCSWIFIQGLFRLFVTGMMWLFEQIAEWITDAIPGLSTFLGYIQLAYWGVFELFLWTSFFWMPISGLLIGVGVVAPMTN